MKSNHKIGIYWLFLKSVMAHKYYVLKAGLKLGGIPLWRLIVHDWQKFTLSEFPAYAIQFFGSDEYKLDNYPSAFYCVDNFKLAWLHHENSAPHHWGYWTQASSGDKFDMPDTYIREMVADWMGASKTYTGSWDMTEWLKENLYDINQHMTLVTCDKVDAVLEEV